MDATYSRDEVALQTQARRQLNALRYLVNLAKGFRPVANDAWTFSAERLGELAVMTE